MFPIKSTRIFRDLLRDGIELQTCEKRFRFFGLMRTHSHVDFRDINRATGKQRPFFNQLFKKFDAAIPAVEGIDDDAAIQ